MNKEYSNVDEQLKQLAILAQQYPPLTQERQLALTKLINGIIHSGRLCHPQQHQFSGVYQDIYNEALQELLLYICQNIDKYNPERGGVMAWSNTLLKRRFFKETIPKFVDKPDIKKLTLADLDNFVFPEEPKTLTEKLKECIESDPEDLFKSEYIENYPFANFQALAKQRILGKTWKEISAEFEIKTSTISTFYYRCLNKFSRKLKEYCIE